jgi:hypothetical protein
VSKTKQIDCILIIQDSGCPRSYFKTTYEGIRDAFSLSEDEMQKLS